MLSDWPVSSYAFSMSGRNRPVNGEKMWKGGGSLKNLHLSTREFECSIRPTLSSHPAPHNFI
jgi:hypothetical protein